MKRITALVPPLRWPWIFEALQSYDIGLTVSEASGHGHSLGDGDPVLQPRYRVDIVADDDLVEGLVETIRGAANTDSPGDGKIWVMPVNDFVRVRTGEDGLLAL